MRRCYGDKVKIGGGLRKEREMYKVIVARASTAELGWLRDARHREITSRVSLIPERLGWAVERTLSTRRTNVGWRVFVLSPCL